MLAVVSGLFFYKNIARLLLWNFADNLHKYKANFVWWFPTNLRVFTVCEGNYSCQFCYFIKKKNKIKYLDNIQSEKRADRKVTHEVRTDSICNIFL